MLCKDGEDFAETICNSRIYSKETLANGYKFPALYVITGNLDETQVVKDLPSFITGMYNYNSNRDKLYPIGYEVHIMDQLYHGRGMALESANVASVWAEADQFIKMNLK